MSKLEQFILGAATYLRAIDPKPWVTAYYVGPYHGHKTSNAVESTNKVFKEQCELPILDLLHTIWNYVMNHRFKWYMKAIHQFYTDYAHRKLQGIQLWAKGNTVQLSSQIRGLITQINHKTFIADQLYRTCTCGYFQEIEIPCGHAFTLIYELRALTYSPSPPHPNSRAYVPYYFTIPSISKSLNQVN